MPTGRLSYEDTKVMICGSMSFNNDVKTFFNDLGWIEGSRNTAGSFVQEKAFVE